MAAARIRRCAASDGDDGDDEQSAATAERDAKSKSGDDCRDTDDEFTAKSSGESDGRQHESGGIEKF